ncbi:DUF2283 domain-containing protein [Kitasatospora purpeofusca]|uniref:DUF2283 domain-containing protein n=1 Tax=Kitasatospora purpeofusca TaxID=67352 RepID=UPI002256EC30|nr:DUF2283 domain-containing protein [Kitasatospora purpeofusca]MCX4688723.1 DUF2283 domain-containing protein [Kitasatospora purpeofusca]
MRHEQEEEVVPLRGTYDAEADAAKLYLVDEMRAGEATTQVVVDVPEGVGEIVLDFDSAGKLLGVEVLGASHLLRDSLIAKLTHR